MRLCKVFVHDVEAGILQETDDRQYIFTYLEDYKGEPVCLAMPVRIAPYQSAFLFPYFFNMLSEGIDEEQKKQFKALIRCDYGFSISTTA